MSTICLVQRDSIPPIGAPAKTRNWADVAITIFVVVAAAGPTLFWALRGGDLLSDDWWVASGVRHGGFWSSVSHMAWVAPARPLAALILSLDYGVIGLHPLPLLLILAGLNAAAALLVLKLARRVLPPRAAVLTALIWASLPNRGSARLWIVMVPVAVAVVLLLSAGLLLTRAEPHIATASVLIALAGLAYEAVVPLGIAGLLYSLWKRGGRQWRVMAVPVFLPLASAAYVFIRSPKRSHGIVPFSNASRLVPANFGTGILGGTALSAVFSVAVLALMAVALVRVTLPGFGPSRPHHRLIAAGCGVLLLGALPFLVAGFPFSTDGIFDRGNIVAGFGVALILAGCGAWLLESRPTRMSVAVLALGVGWMALLNGQDVQDYRAAVTDGKALVAALDRDLPTIPDGGVVVVPPLPNHGGVAMYILGADLPAKLWLDRGGPTAPPIRIMTEGQAGTPRGEAYAYDWRTNSLSTRNTTPQ